MIRGVYYIIILTIIVLLIQVPIFNQSYNIHNYTVKNGLPSGLTFSLTQDISGRMWFASNIGVLEFDNISWTLHKVLEANKNIANMRWILSDSRGIIYVFNRLLGNGGYYYQNKEWKKINGPEIITKEIQVTGTALIEINGKPTIGLSSYKNGLYLYTSGKWRHITKKAGLLDNDIISIDAFNEKFYVLSVRGLSIVSNKLIDNSLNKILPDKGLGLTGIKVIRKEKIKTIWIAGTNWIGKIIDGTFFKIADFNFMISKESGSFLEFRKTFIEYDRRGRLFFGNINAFYFFDMNSKKIKSLGTNNGTTTRGITAILQDRELNVWTSTKRGINKIVSLQFENYSRQNGLLENEVSAIAEISPDKIVFGHNNGLTIKSKNIYKKIQLNKFLKKKIFGSRVFDILIDSKKNMWVAAGTGGLFLFDTGPNYNLKKHWNNTLNEEFITVIEDEQKRIWIAGKKKIWRIKNDELFLISTKRLFSSSVRKMFVIDKNELYFATVSKGIYKLKDKVLKRYFSKENIFNSTYAVSKYMKDSFLIGSSGGLLELKNNKLQLFSSLGWQITNPVYFITKDKQNNYWIGTRNGVSKFNNKYYNHYTHIDGLVGVEANRGGGFTDSSGGVWIGMDLGVSKYTPDMFNVPYPKPLLEITKIKANNIKYKPEEKIELSGKNTIEIFFKSISFLDSGPIKFIYKLEGYDKEWEKKILRHGYVRYDNLPTGNYSFFLKAENGRGTESDIYVIDKIKIISPFYLTYWFALIILLSLLITSFFLRRYFTQIRVSKLLEKEIYKKNIQLKESLLSYQSLFEESLDCIFTSTPDGMFLSINKAGLDMFGYRNIKEISGKKIQNDIYLDRNRREEFKKAMKSKGFVKNFESNLKKKDGTILTVIESSYLIKNNRGDIIGYRGIVRDITDLHKLQTQLVQSQKMESIGLLAGGIAHDFNNILSGILGYANLLKRSLSKDKKLFKYINTIEKSAERAAELTKKLLGFARKGKFKVTLIDINDIIDEVTNLLNPIIDKSIRIVTNMLKPTVLIEADASQIQQVIMNICLNARDALPNGGIINISSKSVNLSMDEQRTFSLTSQEGKYLNISIEDNGFGIKQENLQKIFDPFFTTKRTSKGSGLGLSMVYGVLKNHNGALNVKSINKKGTSFNLYFPINTKINLPQLTNPEPSDSKDILNILSGNETILIIDDEKVHRELLVTILNERGYTTIEAFDGIDGINKYINNKKNINLIILDMSMPNMSGNKTFTKLREVFSGIKVLINSGYSKDDNIQIILNHNFTDFIQKPFKPRQLLIRIRALLEKL